MQPRRAQPSSCAGSDRLACELHDVTLQDLAVLRMELSRLARATDGTPFQSDVAGALERVRDTIVNLRGLLADARPPLLERLGLARAIEAVAEGVRRDADVLVPVAVDVVDPADALGERIGADAETAVLRCVQEAVRNAVRHAHPTRVEVELHETLTGVVLDVRDDGCGFDPAAPAAGHGLQVMRERAAGAGGRLVVVSRRGGGTAVRLRIPMNPRRRDRRVFRRGVATRVDGRGFSART